MQLFSAVATQGAQGVAGEAFRVNTGEHRAVAQLFHRPPHNGQVFPPVQFIAEAHSLEVAKAAGQLGSGHPGDKAFVVEPVADDVGNAHQAQPMVLGIGLQFRQARHGAIRILDFADHPGGIEPGHARQIHRGFGVASPLQNASFPGPKRENVPRTAEILGAGSGANGHLNGARPVLCRDPCRHPVLRCCVNAHREGGLVAVGIAIHHGG